MQSIKSIEEELYNIRKDFQDLRYVNNPNQGIYNNIISNPSVRSLSEPNFVNNVINPNNMYNNNNNPTTSNAAAAVSSNANLYTNDLCNDKDKLRFSVPSLANPRRLRKLTK